MRKKELKLIITFYTAADAMAMESRCRQKGAEGRLIPVPQSISAGCGLAWCAPLSERGKLEQILEEGKIRVQGVQECMA